MSESFGRAAERYDSHAPVQSAMAAWLAEWLPERREGAALEIGAGTGLFTTRAQPWSRGYVASDGSAAMVAQGQARNPGMEWREMRAERVAGGPWAWILSSSMLQWADDPAAVLRGWRAALAPGGRVLTGFYVAETLPELRGLIGGAGPLVWRTHWAWRDAFREAGLSVVRDEVSRRTFEHGSAKDLLRTLHGVGAAPHRLVPPARLLGWLREKGDAPMAATWTFYRCEAESADWLSPNLP
ncbi:MAG: methyltransferase domain-containing protein [Burkholderiales bacterium]|nr:methyltransferase domain-containing protein [Opitutaceae bacterium]